MTVLVPPLGGAPRTLVEAMDAAAHQHGDRDAYVEGSERLSFAEWIARADRLAGVLAGRGVDRGDVVAILLPTSIDYAVAYAAIVRAGAVATGINPRLGPREVEAILERARPRLMITDGALDHGGVDPALPRLGRHEISSAGARVETRAPFSPHPTDPVVIIWTSGTTGVPKGAWFDHRNLEAAVRSAGVMSAPYDRRLVGTPFPHAGYMAKLWDQLAWGSTVVISPTPWTPDDMLRLLVEERITVAGGVPAQWAKLLEHPGLERADVSHLRLCLAATAPAAPELIARVTARLRCPMVVRYAMTESPSITGTDPDDPPEVMFRTVGRPQAGVEILIADERGVAVPAGQVGRVRVHGGCVMRGYWREPELTAGVLSSDGWLSSGDLGYLDSHGNLVLVGRTTDLYIRGGYNIYPLEVEQVLSEHPGVDKVAIVGVPAPVIGEIGVAFLVPCDPDRPPTSQDVRNWVTERLADYKAPDLSLIHI